MQIAIVPLTDTWAERPRYVVVREPPRPGYLDDLVAAITAGPPGGH